MGRITIICLSIVMLVLVAFGVNYYFFSEPKIIAVYKKIDYRKTSVVVVLSNAPTNHRAMYDFWLRIRSNLKEKYDVELNKDINSIVFMKPIYESPSDLENQFCVNNSILNENRRCLSKDQLILGLSYFSHNDSFGVTFHNPFCVSFLHRGKTLPNNDDCFK